jgi:hypothetical protein
MAMLHQPANAIHVFASGSEVLPGAQARSAAELDPFVHGAHKALVVYSRASDAYFDDPVAPSVALWVVLIAGGVVLLEWLLARHRHH